MDTKSPKPKMPIGRSIVIPRPPKQSLAFKNDVSGDSVDGQMPNCAFTLSLIHESEQSSTHQQLAAQTFSPTQSAKSETPFDSCSMVSVNSNKTVTQKKPNKFALHLDCDGDQIEIFSTSESLGKELIGHIWPYLIKNGHRITLTEVEGTPPSTRPHSPPFCSTLSKECADVEQTVRSFSLSSQFCPETKSAPLHTPTENIKNNGTLTLGLNGQSCKSPRNYLSLIGGRKTYSPMELRRFSDSDPSPSIGRMIQKIHMEHPELKRSI